VSYGSENVLGPFLESVGPASTAETAIVVADNLASDNLAADERSGAAASGKVDRVEELARASGAHYLPSPTNLGYGTAMNAGVATLPESVEWILLSNPDVVLAPGAIDRLVEVGDADPRIGSVGPAILNADGSVYPSARSVPSLRTGVGHAMFSNLWPNNPWSRRYRHDTALPGGQRDAGWLSGSCLLVRASAFAELGGFDEGYFMYFEDVDLGYRLGKHGYRNVYEPSAQATHAGAHSTTTESVRMIAAHHTSARRFLARKYSGPMLWPVRATLTVGLTIRSKLVERRITRQGNA
jgi:N-acetylglucosaminyl-diphospho-decaprenol L-rhamnosyltransferase